MIKRNEKPPHAHRTPPGHARPDRPAVAPLGPAARLRPGAAHSRHVARRARCRRRVALSGAPPARAPARREGGVDSRKRGSACASTGSPGGPPATRGRTVAVGADVAGDAELFLPPAAGKGMSLFWLHPTRRGERTEAELPTHLDMDSASASRAASHRTRRGAAHSARSAIVTVREVTTDMWSGEPASGHPGLAARRPRSRARPRLHASRSSPSRSASARTPPSSA